MTINLKNLKKVHIIGIKGSGVVAIAEIFHSMGVAVTGSDTDEKFFTEATLQKLGINYAEKFSPENISEEVDLVVYSTAYNENNNVEFQEAKKRNLPMASYPEILGEFFNERYGLAVCGTHGKTTTSAMLAEVLRCAETDPAAVIGSKVTQWGGNALLGKGEFFVAETDEFQNKLRFYDPKAVILTSCDFDHPDFFPDLESYKQVFKNFVARIPKDGFLTVWGDSVDTLDVAKEAACKVLTYGFGEDCDYRSSKFKVPASPARLPDRQADGQSSKPQFAVQSFEINYKDETLGEFQIQLIGKHNILNATAVVAVCHRLNLDLEKVRKGLLGFQGTARRMEYIGERNGAILIDDYAHHPDEIRPTLQGLREVYPEKTIWAVFHPHTFTRTKALLAEFSQSFSDADNVIVLDIYGSAREEQGGVHSKDLVDLINKYDQGKAEYIPTISEAVEFLKDKIGDQDIVITVGAGNGWEVGEKLKVKS